MTSQREIFRRKLEELVSKFEGRHAEYMAAGYNESQVRVDFIDPLFEALGWDVRNTAGLSWREREVVVESGRTQGRPDYNFRVNGQTRFFVEAKALHVSLDRTDVILQAKKYAWNTKTVQLAVVTDFEEFRLYDASLKPDPKRPEAGLIFSYRYPHYLDADAFENLWMLSRESAHAGSLEALFSQSARDKRQRIPVDESFLADLSHWREQLAKALYKAQPEMSADDLNSAVQVFLNRLVFIRVAEDRNVLPANQMFEIAQQWKLPGKRKPLMASLKDLFFEINAKLNGEIFKPHFSEKARWDEALVAEIIEELYPPSIYRFDVIGVELLGSIYERYLGKTIRTTEKRVFVEDKPEVRKAGGVYYTPKHIVDYIVAGTVGKLIEGKTPDEIAKLKIIDPACGSGSFLLGAYQCLLDYHLKWYTNKANGDHEWDWRIMVKDDSSGEWRLAIQKKAEILVSNIYGVDLDEQAIEITMMSLYIKAIEGETRTVGGRAVLPRLNNNIHCGNSIISDDIRDQLGLFWGRELVNLRAFNWEFRDGVREVMRAGGFDAVIGNPPYLFITEIDETQKQYLFNKYSTAEYRFDVYGVFTELAIRQLARKGGYVSYIIPHTLLSNDSFEKLRRLILAETHLEKVIDIGPGVFAGAKNETMIFVLRNGAQEDAITEVVLTGSKTFPIPSKQFTLPQQQWNETPGAAWLVNVSAEELIVVAKMEKAQFRLGDLCTINQGLRTGDNDKYLSETPKTSKWKPAAGGKQIGRYEPIPTGLYVHYEPELLDAPRRKEIFESAEKLAVQEIRNITLPRRIIATYDDQQFYCLQSTNVINLREGLAWNLKFLLGILNSAAVNFYFRQRFSGNNHIASNQLAQIPVPHIDESASSQIVSLIERMLNQRQHLARSLSDSERQRTLEFIAQTDRQIDHLVYQFYGLTDEEIEVVESS
jgi:type I restriction-modification system DNA methylase subunit